MLIDITLYGLLHFYTFFYSRCLFEVAKEVLYLPLSSVSRNPFVIRTKAGLRPQPIHLDNRGSGISFTLVSLLAAT